MASRDEEAGGNERQLQAARKAAQRSTEFILEREYSEGGHIGKFFGTRHQAHNILAVSVIMLLLMLAGTIAGALVLNNLEIFKTIGALLMSALMTIIGYIVGASRQGATSRQPRD